MVNYERSIVMSENKDFAEEQKECFEVLVNGWYGGFHIPDELRDAIFKLHPPHTEEGHQLFQKNSIDVYTSEDQIPTDVSDNTYILVTHYEDFKDDYKIIKGYFVSKYYSLSQKSPAINYTYITRGDGKFYDYTPYIGYGCEKHNRVWREHKDVIRLFKELGYNERESKSTIRISHVPVGRSYYIDEYDGMESIKLKPFAKKVMKDLIRIIQTGDKEKLHPETKKLLKGETTIDKVLSSYY